MKFIGFLLEQIDSIWVMWMWIAVPIGLLLLVQAVPIPLAIFMLCIIKHEFTKASILKDINPSLHAGCILNGVTYFLITVGVFVGMIYADLHGTVIACYDYSGQLPGMLPALIKHFITC